MAERPILFSGPMVRALLDGRKTQTRRVVKPQPEFLQIYDYKGVRVYDASHRSWCWKGKAHGRYPDEWGPSLAAMNPYGVHGDELWVKETWRTEARHDGLKPTLLPDGALISFDADYQQQPNDGCRGKTRVSLHMQRRHSRISLRITDVRAERLNDCSEADALAEGISCLHDGFGIEDMGSDQSPIVQPTAVQAYRFLWERINGPGAWAANPWVWAVSFEVAR